MKRTLAVSLLALGIIGCVLARLYARDEYLPAAGKFRTCEERTGKDIFWVDSTSGKLWVVDPVKPGWTFAGQPEGAMPGPAGTYLLVEARGGESAVFILNSASGEGWWSNGHDWKKLGVPTETPPAKN